MRTPLVCALLALLGVAAAAHAQGWPVPGYPANYYAAGNGYPSGPRDFYHTNGPYPQPQFQPQPLPVPAFPTPPEDPTSSPLAEHVAAKEKNAYWWINSSYDFTWIRSQTPKIPLITSSLTPDLPQAGAVGQQGTVVLYDSGISHDTFSGIRAEVGVFIDPERTLSLEAAGWWVLPNHERFSLRSDAAGVPSILRPAFDVVSNSEIGVIDALPNTASGRVDLSARAEIFGLELNGRWHSCLIEKKWFVDGLCGFRYLSLSETLTIRDQATPLIDGGLSFLGQRLPAGAMISDVDDFSTTNKFYGAQIGGRVRLEGPMWLVHFTGKVAAGATDMDGYINGSSRVVTPTQQQVASGGVLALANNIGRQNQTVFGFVPEGGLNVGVKLFPCVSLQAGYSFLFWSQVIRPSGMIDRNVNATTLPTSQQFGATNTAAFRPTQSFAGESFWVHSVSLRLAVSY